jgi:predicted RNase H-like HicB family nuclease
MEVLDREVEDGGRYSMVFEWEPEGGVYVLTVPELPGCRTHGRTHEEAVKHGREVIELWIDSVREDDGFIPRRGTSTSTRSTPPPRIASS